MAARRPSLPIWVRPPGAAGGRFPPDLHRLRRLRQVCPVHCIRSSPAAGVTACRLSPSTKCRASCATACSACKSARPTLCSPRRWATSTWARPSGTRRPAPTRARGMHRLRRPLPRRPRRHRAAREPRRRPRGRVRRLRRVRTPLPDRSQEHHRHAPGDARPVTAFRVGFGLARPLRSVARVRNKKGCKETGVRGRVSDVPSGGHRPPVAARQASKPARALAGAPPGPRLVVRAGGTRSRRPTWSSGSGAASPQPPAIATRLATPGRKPKRLHPSIKVTRPVSVRPSSPTLLFRRLDRPQHRVLRRPRAPWRRGGLCPTPSTLLQRLVRRARLAELGGHVRQRRLLLPATSRTACSNSRIVSHAAYDGQVVSSSTSALPRVCRRMRSTARRRYSANRSPRTPLPNRCRRTRRSPGPATVPACPPRHQHHVLAQRGPADRGVDQLRVAAVLCLSVLGQQFATRRLPGWTSGACR